MSTQIFTLPDNFFAQVAQSSPAVEHPADPDVVLADENADPDDLIIDGINFTKTTERMLAKADMSDLMPPLVKSDSETSSVAPATPTEEVETVSLRDLEIVPSVIVPRIIPTVVEANSTSYQSSLDAETDSFDYPTATFDPIPMPFPEFCAPAPVAVHQMPFPNFFAPQLPHALPAVSPYDFAVYQQLMAMSQLAYAAQLQRHTPHASRATGPTRTAVKPKQARAVPYVVSRPSTSAEAWRGKAARTTEESLVTGWQPAAKASESPKPKPRGRRTERPHMPMHLWPKGMPLPGMLPPSMQRVGHVIEKRGHNVDVPIVID